MTQPRFARQRSGREYLWPFDPPHELMVPSTTTIIGGGVPKEALRYWAAKMVAEFAYDNVETWPHLKRADAVDLLKRAPFRFTEHKAEVGDCVHAAIETYLGRRAIVPMGKVERGYFDGAMAFLVDQEVEVLRAEATVFSRTHGYAGTADLFFRTPVLDGAAVVGDWKTAKAVYDETGLQLAASAFADFIADPDGHTEIEMPNCEYGVTIRLTTTGNYEAVPFQMTRKLFDIFLAAKVVADRESTFRTVRGLPLAPPRDEEKEAA